MLVALSTPADGTPLACERGLWSADGLAAVDTLARRLGSPVEHGGADAWLPERLALAAGEALGTPRVTMIGWAAAVRLVETLDDPGADALDGALSEVPVPHDLRTTLRIALERRVRRPAAGQGVLRPALPVFGAAVVAGVPADEALQLARAFDPTRDLFALQAELSAAEPADRSWLWRRLSALEDAVVDAPALAPYPRLVALACDLCAAAIAPVAVTAPHDVLGPRLG